MTDAGVDTPKFIAASEGLVGLFGEPFTTIHFSPYLAIDLLGSAAFSVVQADLRGNITVR